MTKSKLKDQVEGNELDLSLNELSEVPVQELAEITKATHLDLSCNKITKLPDNFPSLTHLVKLDLSKNNIVDLPYNFGNLTHLQWLDLYKNKLEMLPISFCRLKNLKWLDLKDNPLKPEIKGVAGDCLDSKQCAKCAVDVVIFMQTIESELERQKQKKLKEEREREAAQKAKEQRELEEQRKIKKAEKERRKAEAKARKNDLDAHKQTQKSQASEAVKTEANSNHHTSMNPEEKPKKSGYWFIRLLLFLMLVPFLFVINLVFFRIYELSEWSPESCARAVEEVRLEVWNLLQLWWNGFVHPYLSSLPLTYQDWKKMIE